MTSTRPTAAEWISWGIDPSWSRTVHAGGLHWHVLDTGPPTAAVTIVCVHGNPTWSFLWRSFLTRFGDRYRVVAVDQLGMGYSQRTGRRRYEQRIDDLDDIIGALAIDGPIIFAAHDWGGAISLGWAVRHPERVRAMVLTNTGIAIPDGLAAPWVIRLAGARALNRIACEFTPAFVEATLRLSGGRIGPDARRGYRAPYRSRASRRAIAEFVDDVPFTAARPSAAPIAAVAADLHVITAPVLLAWGGRDPVFSDEFADDLEARLTGTKVDRHRFPTASHLVVEECDVAALADRWLHRTAPATETAVANTDTIWPELESHRSDPAAAFIAGSQRIDFAELVGRIERSAAGLRARGVLPGDRVALLIPPSIDLVVAVYGCWRAGAVTVIADRGLGLRALARAVRGSGVRWLITIPKAAPILRVLRAAPAATMITTGTQFDRIMKSAAPLPAPPAADDAAAVVFTSGATGPAKGVRYTHGQLSAQRDALRATYAITAGDRLVAAFAPFALYGPALGITSTIPDVDVTKPATLTAAALSDACAAIDATVVFASPSALTNVVETARAIRFGGVRLVLSAGAPVPVAMLRRASLLFPNASLHTPYGMTEALPVADIDLAGIEQARGGQGVCVGRPVSGAGVRIDPDNGEVLVRAPWVSAGYDRLWRTEADARPAGTDGLVWHRSGDVGNIDEHGRLWIEGRTAHVITTVAGPVTPVPVEVAVEAALDIPRCAATGVGPAGCQQLVVVVELPGTRAGLASATIAARVRAAVDHTVAAVLTVGSLPVDVRHNAKIDRTLVGRWAGRLLAGGPTKVPW